jgi:hypothetical protein
VSVAATGYSAAVPSTARVLAGLSLLVVGATAGGLGAAWAVEVLRDPVCRVDVDGHVERLTPEQAANAATISTVARQRDLPPRAVTLALATAVQESKLRNLAYGDADSLGLFQQRPSQGWGTPEQVTDPVHAAGRFFDVLVRVDGWETGVLTEVAQEVQRSAYPDAYADHETEAEVLAAALTGQVTRGIGCRLDRPSPAEVDPAATAEKAARQLGDDLTPTVDATARLLTFTAGDEGSAWTVAGWAVSHAEAEEVVAVSVAGLRWDRDDRPLEWHDDDAGVGDATTVVVQLAAQE